MIIKARIFFSLIVVFVIVCSFFFLFAEETFIENKKAISTFLLTPIGKPVFFPLQGLERGSDLNYISSRWLYETSTSAFPESICFYPILKLAKDNFALQGLYDFQTSKAIKKSSNIYTINKEGWVKSNLAALGKFKNKGWVIEHSYYITNNFVVSQQLKMSSAIIKSLGPMFRFNQYEADFVYAF